MRRRVRLTESDLHRIIRESVKRVINEEIDLGQIDAMRDRPRAKKVYRDVPADIKREIRRLRQLIDDYNSEGRDTASIENVLRKLKNKYYYVKRDYDDYDYDYWRTNRPKE